MCANRYYLEDNELVELERKMALLPGKMERAITDTLHVEGVKYSTEEITRVMPVSRRNKRHAKTSRWSKANRENLGFTVKSKGGAANKKGSFGYLVFPDEGRGSSNPIAQRFMQVGLGAAVPRFMAELHTEVDRTLEEEL